MHPIRSFSVGTDGHSDFDIIYIQIWNLCWRWQSSMKKKPGHHQLLQATCWFAIFINVGDETWQEINTNNEFNMYLCNIRREPSTFLFKRWQFLKPKKANSNTHTHTSIPEWFWNYGIEHCEGFRYCRFSVWQRRKRVYIWRIHWSMQKGNICGN